MAALTSDAEAVSKITEILLAASFRKTVLVMDAHGRLMPYRLSEDVLAPYHFEASWGLAVASFTADCVIGHHGRHGITRHNAQRFFFFFFFYFFADA
jgi:hypothetical protein